MRIRPARSASPALSACFAALLLSGLTACGDGTPPPDHTGPAPAKSSTTMLKAAECTVTPPAGRVVRSGYGLEYTAGEMTISVTSAGRAARCLRFSKSGPADPNVPPDAVLFTFAGDRGEGAQLEFLAVDLAGAVLPWPVGASARTPGSPITSTVGISIDGTYYTSPSCVLKLQTVTEEKASGRFDCPEAVAQTGNPLNPDDDVTYDDEPDPTTAPPQTPTAPSTQPPPSTPTAPTKTAKLSGLFTVRK